MRKRALFITRQDLTSHGNGVAKSRRPLLRSLFAAVLVGLLALPLMACGGGYTTRGERTTESHLGSRGEIDVQVGSANGSVPKDIEFDYADAIVDVEVTLEVEKGTFKLEFLGEDDEVTLVLEARSGEEVSSSGYMVTDTFGEGEYRVTASEAEGVHYHISYQVR